MSGFTLALLVGFLWLASGQGNKDNAYYDILFSEDVTGLQVGGVVRYRGVEVEGWIASNSIPNKLTRCG